MKRRTVIKILCQFLPKDTPVISSTGLISREIYGFSDSERNFYMTGSFGLASSIGLGIAACNLKRKIVVVEGDASLLTDLGSLATIGNYVPQNLVHICLDNQAYDSCGGEPSATKTVDLSKLVAGAGYKTVIKTEGIKELKRAIKNVLIAKGPVFILVKIRLGGERNLPRPLDLPKIAYSFRNFLSKNK